MKRKVNEALCKKCRFRSRKGTWEVHRCSYFVIVGKVRADEAGFCTKFEESGGRNSGKRAFSIRREELGDGDAEACEEGL
jgi:hypothetical protein